MQPPSSAYTLRLSALALIAFIALRHLFHEIHEFAHMVAGYLFCGEWGTRDFNNVSPVVEGCDPGQASLIAVALAGPAFNYLAIWAGALLVWRARTAARLSWGLVIVFASLPFARLFTALMGGGDELGVARSLLGQGAAARVADIAVIAALLAWPLYVVWQALGFLRHRAAWFAGMLLAPMLLEGMVVLGLLNGLLRQGVLDGPGAMGAPLFVVLVLGAALVVTLLSARRLSGSIVQR